MDYLQLVQRLKQECGVQGDAPTTTVGLTGMFKKLADWVSQAHYEIEQQCRWNWMYRQTTLPITAGSRTVVTTTISPTNAIGIDDKLIYSYATDPNSKLQMEQKDYREMLRLFDTVTVRTGQPRFLAISPTDNSFYLDATPDQNYTLYFGYWREPVTLKSSPENALDDKVIPAMPVNYHMLIVYQAMVFYAQHEGAMDVRQEAMNMYNEMLWSMSNTELPEMKFNKKNRTWGGRGHRYG